MSQWPASSVRADAQRQAMAWPPDGATVNAHGDVVVDDNARADEINRQILALIREKRALSNRLTRLRDIVSNQRESLAQQHNGELALATAASLGELHTLIEAPL